VPFAGIDEAEHPQRDPIGPRRGLPRREGIDRQRHDGRLGVPSWPRAGPPRDAADVVVTHAGQNALAEIAAARRPAVVVPQQRPHDEQRATGRALAAAGTAAVAPLWPAAQDWPALLDEAVDRGGLRWGEWSDGRGAARAAAVLDGLAGGAPCAPRS
jgi:hypothetical protein